MTQIIEASIGERLWIKTSAAITEGQVVEVTGVRTVGPAGNDSKKAVGVALMDIAQGDKGEIYLLKPLIRMQDSGSGITAGDRVACAASGKIKTYTPLTWTGYVAATSGGSPTIQETAVGAAGATFAGDKDYLGVAFDTLATNGWGSVFWG